MMNRQYSGSQLLHKLQRQPSAQVNPGKFPDSSRRRAVLMRCIRRNKCHASRLQAPASRVDAQLSLPFRREQQQRIGISLRPPDGIAVIAPVPTGAGKTKQRVQSLLRVQWFGQTHLSEIPLTSIAEN